MLLELFTKSSFYVVGIFIYINTEVFIIIYFVRIGYNKTKHNY